MSKLLAWLVAQSGLSESDARMIVMRAPVSYKRYTIEKRTGGKRLISQPAREVKALQRILMRGLARLPVHNAAAAYRVGISIRDNAARHAHNGPVMKFDFEQFFPSIRDSDWVSYCVDHEVFTDPNDVRLSARLLFHRMPGSEILRLAIGAPSSPWLSNVLMYDFDAAITELVAHDKVTYSRYADDLTFSAPRTGYLNKVEKTVRTVLKDMQHPRLKLNDAKYVVATKKYRRVVTGLVLANDGRVTIGRDRKRLIRAMLHHSSQGKLTAEELGRLAGLLAFVHDVEPAFFMKLTASYGDDLLKRLTTGA